MRKEHKILLAIVLVSLFLRFLGANAYFSGDEIDTVGPARSFVVSGDFRVYDTADGPLYNFAHPPVRMLLYSYWAAFFGFSNIALRLIPILLGTAFVVILYYLGKTLYSEKVGLIAAGLATVSRYAIWFSDTVSVDTGHFLFTTSAAVLFFLLYTKKSNRKYMFISLILAVISVLTKFSTIIIFVPIFATALIYKRTRVALIFIAATCITSLFLMFVISGAFLNSEVFQQPLRTFVEYSSSSATSLNDYLFNKVFKVTTITWQMTPFFAMLLVLALYGVKKTEEFWILSFWLIMGFLIVVFPYGQDAQRYFGVAIAPAFILVGKYIEKVNFRDKFLAVLSVGFLAFSLVINLNDLMGYYTPIYIGLFYLLALVPLIYKKQMHRILLAGFLGLCIFFAFSHASNLYIVSDTVQNLSDKVIELNYPYKEVWSSKDIPYYIAPYDEVAYVNLIPDINFLNRENLTKNNVKYVAFYSTPDEAKIKMAVMFCKNPHVYTTYGHTIGFVCEIDPAKLA